MNKKIFISLCHSKLLFPCSRCAASGAVWPSDTSYPLPAMGFQRIKVTPVKVLAASSYRYSKNSGYSCLPGTICFQLVRSSIVQSPTWVTSMKTLMLDAIFHIKFNNFRIMDPNLDML
jgi:hypothetical protein